MKLFNFHSNAREIPQLPEKLDEENLRSHPTHRFRFIRRATIPVAFLTLLGLLTIFLLRPIPLLDFSDVLNLDSGPSPWPELRIFSFNGGPSTDPSPRHVATGGSAMVASDVPLCSELGTQILRRGGSAADAAVTIALCIGSINSFSSGIGGGGYLVIRAGNGSALSIDARETAPRRASKHMFDAEPRRAQVGGLAVATPGELRGLHEAFLRFSSGKLTWRELVEPVADLNERGFAASEVMEYAVALGKEYFIENYKDWTFLFRDGDWRKGMVRQGDLVRRPEFARTLRIIAEDPMAFYDPSGPLVKSMVQYVKSKGGILEPQDFAEYNVEVSEPLRTEFAGYEVLTCSGSCSGPALMMGLNVMDGFEYPNGLKPKEAESEGSDGKGSGALEGKLGLKEAEFGSEFGTERTKGDPKSRSESKSDIGSDIGSENADTDPKLWPVINPTSETYLDQDFDLRETQRMVETMKWMAAARTELGDPSGSVNGSRIQELLTLDYSDFVRSRISDSRTFGVRHYGPKYASSEPHGTAHFSVVDANGGSVSMTTTVNLLFGALLHDPHTGVVFNSEMDDFAIPNRSNAFDLPPSVYNFVKPFKRPLSSSVPVIVVDREAEQPVLVIGAAGGSRILTAVFQAVIRTIRHGLPLLETVAFPRVHHQLVPKVAYLEAGVPDSAVAHLKAVGHMVEEAPPKSAMNGVHKVDGVWQGVADYWRKRGGAAGY